MSKFVPLSACMLPPKSKSWSCSGCKLYQYAPIHIFTKEERKCYEATLDPERADKKNNSYKLGPEGPDDAEVMVVMEAPTRSEDDYGNAFTAGPARIVRRNAKDCGLEPEDWRWNYLLRCANPDDEEMSLPSMVYCSRYLSQDVLRVKPKVIVTFGAKATAAVLGKPSASINHFATVAQKAVVAGHECVVYPMLSPGYILRNDYLARRYLEHFKKLAEHLTGKTEVLEDSSIYRIVTTPDEAIEVCQKMIAAVEEGVTIDADTETSNLNPFKMGQRLSVISLARSMKRGYAIMYNHDESAWTDADRKRVNKEGLKPLFAHRKLKVRWHNGKFDVKWIRKHLKFWPRDQSEDTMLTHYALDENVEHGLKPLALMYTDMGDYDEELDKYLATQDVPDKPRYDLVPMNLLGKYAAQDPVATRKLAVALKRESERQDEPVRALAYRVLPAISAASTRLEYNGLAIDTEFGNKVAVPYLETASKQSYDAILSDPTVRKFIRDREQQERQKYIDGLKGRLDKKTNLRVKKSLNDLPPIDVKRYFEFSLNSPDQLCTLLYEPEYFAHPPILSRKTGNISTDKDAMQELIKQKSPIAKAIQEFRLDEKLVSTYARPMLAACAEQGDNIMHPNILAHGTKCVTGDTEVLTEHGLRPIRELVVHRRVGFASPPNVRVWDGAGWRRPVAAYYGGRAATVQLTTSDGGQLEGTLEHPVLTPQGWCHLGALRPGDEVVRYASGVPTRVSVARTVNKDNIVFDLTMEYGHVADAVPFVSQRVSVSGDARPAYSRVAPRAVLGAVPDRGMDAGSAASGEIASFAEDAQGSCVFREDADGGEVGEHRAPVHGRATGCQPGQYAGGERAILGASSQSAARGGTATSDACTSAPRGPGLYAQGPSRSSLPHAFRPGAVPAARFGRRQDAQSRVLDGARESETATRPPHGVEPRGQDRATVTESVGALGGRRVSDMLALRGRRAAVAQAVDRQDDLPGFPGRGTARRSGGVWRGVAPAGGRSETDSPVALAWVPLSGRVESRVAAIERCHGCADREVRDLTHAFVTNGFISHNTGRASTKNPNLQATPNKGASLIKRMVVSRFGAKGVIVQADYSQIELRILAAVSGDPKMIDAYATGKDLHLLTACLIFNLTEQQYHALDKATQKKYRTIAKRVNFGIAYGIGAPGIVGTLHSEGVDVEESEAKKWLDIFYRKYPRVTKWIARVEDTTHEDEFSRSLFGRRRRLLEITSEISDTVARAERQAVNHVIQSSAADFTWTSMVLMDQEIQLRSGRDPELLLPTITRREFPVDERWKDVNLVLQVHDSILVDCPVEMTGEVVDMFNRTMPKVVDLAPIVWGDWVTDRLKVMRKVATQVDVEVGPSWRDAYKVKVLSDVPKALFIANRMKAKCDTDPRYKWDEKDEEEALAAFKKEAA